MAVRHGSYAPPRNRTEIVTDTGDLKSPAVTTWLGTLKLPSLGSLVKLRVADPGGFEPPSVCTPPALLLFTPDASRAGSSEAWIRTTDLTDYESGGDGQTPLPRSKGPMRGPAGANPGFPGRPSRFGDWNGASNTRSVCNPRFQSLTPLP